jgi:hypothetical protein
MNKNSITTIFFNGKTYLVNFGLKKKNNSEQMYIHSFPSLPKEFKTIIKDLFLNTPNKTPVFL